MWYLVSPTRGFSLVFYPNNRGITEDGTVDQQVSAPFSTGSLKGQYAFFMQGSSNVGSNLLTRNGTFIPDGNGNLNINETTNLYGGSSTGAVVTWPIFLTGNTYTVGAQRASHGECGEPVSKPDPVYGFTEQGVHPAR